MDSPAPQNRPVKWWWKALAIRALFFGLGMATLFALVLGGFLFYQHRQETKPWASPMQAKFTGMDIKRPSDDTILVEAQYAIENTTAKDYRLPYNSTVMLLLPNGQGYRSGEQAHVDLDRNLFIPAKQKVNINLTWSLQSVDYTLPPTNDLSKETGFVDRRLSESDGFAIFDQTNRYRIDLPNAWNDWPSVKKIRDEQKR